MINIVLNGESRKVENEVTLDRMLDLFSLPRQRVAIELNRSVVPRGDWPATLVADGDVIEVIHFVGGGLSDLRNRIVDCGSEEFQFRNFCLLCVLCIFA